MSLNAVAEVAHGDNNLPFLAGLSQQGNELATRALLGHAVPRLPLSVVSSLPVQRPQAWGPVVLLLYTIGRPTTDFFTTQPAAVKRSVLTLLTPTADIRDQKVGL